MTWLGALLLVAAVLLGVGPSPRRRLARLRPVRSAQQRTSVSGWSWEWLAVPTLAGLGLLGWGAPGLASGLALGLVTATAAGLWRRHRRRKLAEQTAADVVDACRVLGGLLRVGHLPSFAVRLAATDAPLLAEVVSAQQVGGSTPATLRRLGERPGARGLIELAAAWEVAERTGASLTATLDALTNRLSAEQKVARTISAELAAPRASGQVLAVLPVAGVGLGYAIGGDPLQFFLATLVGQLCLVGGVGLACAGVWWIERLAEVTK